MDNNACMYDKTLGEMEFDIESSIIAGTGSFITDMNGSGLTLGAGSAQ